MTTCNSCGNSHFWNWEEAFDKFGFGDGDGLVMTESVANALRKAGCDVTVEPWGCHNVVITEIKRRGQSLIPESIQLGYDDPRDYLPNDIVVLLDAEFTDDTEVLQ
jgi:hypothetical protein